MANQKNKEQIQPPLWDLMLLTNDCYPGCGCDDDRFHMTPERVREAVEEIGLSDAKIALKQLDNLTQTIEIGGFRNQTNRGMETKQAIQWLEEWITLIQNAIKEKSAL